MRINTTAVARFAGLFFLCVLAPLRATFSAVARFAGLFFLCVFAPLRATFSAVARFAGLFFLCVFAPLRATFSAVARFAGLLPLLLLPALAFTQPRFKAAVVAGLTASQIDGDLSAGYHKLGVQGGLRGIARLKPRQDLSIEFLYSQRGCKSTLLKDQFDPYRFSHTLNYVEVPVMWNYKDWLIEGDDEADNFYRVAFNIGLSYARLLGASSKGEGSGIRSVLEPEIRLKKSDVSFLLGANLMASRHLGFTFRYVRSLGRMYNPTDFDPAPYPYTLNGHCLYFQAFYLF